MKNDRDGVPGILKLVTYYIIIEKVNGRIKLLIPQLGLLARTITTIRYDGWNIHNMAIRVHISDNH